MTDAGDMRLIALNVLSLYAVVGSNLPIKLG
jgi:hypothetical protein